MSFKLPDHLSETFRQETVKRYLQYFSREEGKINTWIESETLPSHFVPSFFFHQIRENRKLIRVEKINSRIEREAVTAADRAIALLENRVDRQTSVTETADPVHLRLNNSESLIEGNLNVIDTEGNSVAVLKIRMIYNYRYGSNSSNGHITQYVQLRCNRVGQGLEGKTRVQLIDEAKNAEKAAAKAEKRIAAKARFEKGLIREAKRYERNAADLDKYPEYHSECTQAHLDHWANLKKSYLEVAASLRKATAETPFHKANEETTIFDRFGGSASSYADHLSNRRPIQNNA